MNAFLPGIYLAALLHGAFIISLLLKKDQRRPANWLLAGFIGIVMVSLWNMSMPILDVPSSLQFRIIDVNLFTTPFFWGPFVYLYVLHMIGLRTENWKTQGAHFVLPFLFTLCQFLPTSLYAGTSFASTMLNLFYIQAAIYVVLAYRLVLAHQKRIQETFSQIDHIHLNWLRQLLAVFVATLAIDFLLAQAVRAGMIAFDPALGLIVLLESATIFVIGYLSLQQPQILFPRQQETNGSKKKYDNSALDDPLSKQLADQLVTLMETTQPYKRNDLKLGDLAELMGLSNHHLSQVINEQLKCNFYEFVNQYRIQYAAEIMREHSQINITRLAFDAGFNNRVSFTNAFKKQTGLTPSAYLKNQTLPHAV